MALVVGGARDQLVVLRDGRLGHIPIESVAGKQRKVPADDPLLLSARAVGTSFGD
jgi:6-phosphofructokinase 1